MGDTTLRLGFIGGGLNSAVGNTHRISSQIDNRWRLESGCFSRNPEVNRATAKEYGISTSRTYSSWNDMLQQERERLDAICILTPTTKHVDLVLNAINMGYAIICEKAMAASYKEAIDICKAVERNKTFLAVTYNYTGYPMLRELRSMIFEGRLGTLNQIQIEMPQEGFARFYDNGKLPQPQQWRLEDTYIPTISLDLGVHLHNMVYFLCQEKPIEVVAHQDSYGHFRQVVDNVVCIGKYTGNLTVNLWYSKAALGYSNGLRVRVFGDKGSAEWYQMNPEELRFNDCNGKREIIDRVSDVLIANQLRYNRFKAGHPAGFIEAFANLYYDIAECLLDYRSKGYYNSPYVFGPDQAKDGLELLEAIANSANNQTWQIIKSTNRPEQYLTGSM